MLHCVATEILASPDNVIQAPVRVRVGVRVRVRVRVTDNSQEGSLRLCFCQCAHSAELTNTLGVWWGIMW